MALDKAFARSARRSIQNPYQQILSSKNSRFQYPKSCANFSVYFIFVFWSLIFELLDVPIIMFIPLTNPLNCTISYFCDMDKNTFYNLDDFNAMGKSTLVENLGIIFTRQGKDFLEAEMPVNEQTIQPQRILHGGANLALAETIGGALSLMVLDPEKYVVKGMEINANHVRSVSYGDKVTAKATFLHRGNNSHIVQIDIRNKEDNRVSICRLTNFIQKNNQDHGNR